MTSNIETLLLRIDDPLLKEAIDLLLERIESLENAYASGERYCIQQRGTEYYATPAAFATKELAEAALKELGSPADCYVNLYENPDGDQS